MKLIYRIFFKSPTFSNSKFNHSCSFLVLLIETPKKLEIFLGEYLDITKFWFFFQIISPLSCDWYELQYSYRLPYSYWPKEKSTILLRNLEKKAFAKLVLHLQMVLHMQLHLSMPFHYPKGDTSRIVIDAMQLNSITDQFFEDRFIELLVSKTDQAKKNVYVFDWSNV